MYQQVLPGTVHQAEEEFACRHVVGGDIEARPGLHRRVECQRRNQCSLDRRRRRHLGLSLLEAP